MHTKNTEIVNALRADQRTQSLSYKELAVIYGIGWQNLRRLMRDAGIAKLDARSGKRKGRHAAIKADRDTLGLSVTDLMAKHGVSRMTVFRALALGQPKRVKHVKSLPNRCENPPIDVVKLYGLRAAKTYLVLLQQFQIGKKLKRLTVTEKPFQRRVSRNAVHWFIPLACECGKQVVVSVCHLRKGRTTSCGCARADRIGLLNKTHGCSTDRLIGRLSSVYAQMLSRCAVNPDYASHVTVFDEWRNDKIKFMLWSLENGFEPGLNLDRIDNTASYSPQNCRYTTDIINANNRSTSSCYSLNGQTGTLADICRSQGLAYRTVQQRLRTYKWPLERAVQGAELRESDYPRVYLAHKKSANALTVGRSASWTSRFRKLKREGFTLLASYRVSAGASHGFLEFLLQQWLDDNKVERGVTGKSKFSQASWETFSAVSAVRAGFKFRKLCCDLESSVPALRIQLREKIEAMRVLSVKVPRTPKPVRPLLQLASFCPEPEPEAAADFETWLSSKSVLFTKQGSSFLMPAKGLAVNFICQAESVFCESGAAGKNHGFYMEMRQRGVHVLTLWADDWLRKRAVVQHWLAHKLGMGVRLCSARQCAPGPVTAGQASEFYTKYHLQGPVPGAHYGLFFNSALAACVTLSKSPPERRRPMPSGTLVLARFAVAGSVPGAASRLFKHAVAASKATEIITFSDNSYADGGVYVALGFKMDGELEPDYRVWHPRYGLRHKSFWQRKCIPTRIKDLGLDLEYDPGIDSRTEREMCQIIGCGHAWDCGKVRWRLALSPVQTETP